MEYIKINIILWVLRNIIIIKYLSYVGKTFVEIRYKQKMNTNILPHV